MSASASRYRRGIEPHIVEVLLDSLESQSTVLDNFCLVPGALEELQRNLLIDDVCNQSWRVSFTVVTRVQKGNTLSSARRTLKDASPPRSAVKRLLASRAGRRALHMSCAFVGDSTQLVMPRSRQY